MTERNRIITYLVLLVLAITFLKTFCTKITFKHTDCKGCTLEENYFVKLVKFTLEDCVEGCAKRKQCMALHYLRRFGLCELNEYEDNSEETKTDGHCKASSTKEQCIYVRKGDINVDGEPDSCNKCVKGQVCDWSTGTCIYSECPKLDLDGIIIHGNMNSVGSGIKYSCKPEYEKMARYSPYSVCNERTGQWDPQPRCLQNVALNKAAYMSGVYEDSSSANYVANKGVDGNIDPNFRYDDTNSCFHTSNSTRPWWQVDLGDVFKIPLVKIYNVVDLRANRTINVVLSVGNQSDIFTDIAYKPGQIQPIEEFVLEQDISAQFVKLWINTTNTFILCEVQVWGERTRRSK